MTNVTELRSGTVFSSYASSFVKASDNKKAKDKEDFA